MQALYRSSAVQPARSCQNASKDTWQEAGNHNVNSKHLPNLPYNLLKHTKIFLWGQEAKLPETVPLACSQMTDCTIDFEVQSALCSIVWSVCLKFERLEWTVILCCLLVINNLLPYLKFGSWCQIRYGYGNMQVELVVLSLSHPILLPRPCHYYTSIKTPVHMVQ